MNESLNDVERDRILNKLQSGVNDLADRQVKRIESLENRLAAMDGKPAPGAVEKLALELKSCATMRQLMETGQGSASIILSGENARLFERKTTVSEAAVGSATSGVLQIERIPGITPEARQVLTVRGVLDAKPTTMQLVDFVRVNSAMSKASPQTETYAKLENAIGFESKSERVKTIATWIPASRQVLDDFTELSQFLASTLTYYVNLAEEVQLLAGSGTNEDLDGLITQATAFDTTLLSAHNGWNKIDQVGCAIQQISAAKELLPTFVCMHPSDWWSIRLTKDSFGRYILGDPQIQVRPSLFSLDVVPTTSISVGTFLVGSGNPAASQIRDRQEIQVEVSTQHSDYFTRNLVAIRAEKRLALCVMRPNSYIHGSFSTSPSS